MKTNRSLDSLANNFRLRAEKVIENCSARGVIMTPFCTLRDPWDQCINWRQSRSGDVVQAQIDKYKAQGAHFLAECLESVGPRNGPRITGARPEQSWHCFGEAIDCFWNLGTAEWSITKEVDGQNGYKVYAEEAVKLGLIAGGYWRNLKDWVHIQVGLSHGPHHYSDIIALDKMLERRFS